MVIRIFNVGFGLFRGLVCNMNKVDHCQPYPLIKVHCRQSIATIRVTLEGLLLQTLS